MAEPECVVRGFTDEDRAALTEPCPCCYQGRWETECCSGAGGCSCRGDVIDMGPCNVCGGAGEVCLADEIDRRANIRTIEGACFIGSGPSSGVWADQGTRLNR